MSFHSFRIVKIMSVLLEGRSYRPFKSSEEYLIAMKEDLAEWLNALYPELRINLDNFMDRLDTGVALCKVSVCHNDLLVNLQLSRKHDCPVRFSARQYNTRNEAILIARLIVVEKFPLRSRYAH